MNMVKNRLEDILNKTLERPQGTLVPNEISKTGLNSLMYVKFIVSLEETFDIEFSDEHLSYETFLTIDEIVIYIENGLSKKQA